MRNIKFKNIVLLIILGLGISNFKNDNYVPDEVTAIKIAEAVWLPLYGKSIYESLPFEAYLDGDTVWQVSGSMPQSYWEINKNGDSIIHITLGGVPYMSLRKDNGQILEVGHSK